MAPRKLAAGNWKMNGTRAALAEIDQILTQAQPGCDVLICPPATLIHAVATKGIPTGGQDCHAKPSGAHTGDIAADQLRDAGVNLVIWPVSLLRISMGAAGRALDTLNEEGHLTSKLGEMQHRADLYDLIDYESYNHFDSGVFNFTITKE